MDIEVLINNIVQTVFLPPGISIVMMLLGLFIIQRFYTTGKILLISGFALLIILSLPITAHGLNSLLETDQVLNLKRLKASKAKAIVVLGAGRYKNALEYPNKKDSISKNALERLRYAVYLHKRSGLPILVSGGSPYGRMQSEASIMQDALKNIFNLKAKWLDANSSNTWNNAKLSAKILQQNNIKNIILVTNADHLPRARLAFEHFGLNITAAPLGFKARNHRDSPYTILDLLPSANAMSLSSSAIHEFIGYTWYVIRYIWLA